jgi:hypothetical protein
MSNTPFLSKSKYLSGLQCHKLLWYHYNAKDQIPPISAAPQAIFDQGHIVGELVKQLYPEGIDVAPRIIDPEKNIEETQKVISLRKPLFEAAFKYKNAYARVDILIPVGKHQWDIIEVKSSTHVKDINLHDLALQWYTYSGAGIILNKCFIMYINNKYVRKGEIDPAKLFAKEDVTESVLNMVPSVERNLESFIKTIQNKEMPHISIGPHCNIPYPCVLTDICWKFLPKNNPLSLYYFNTKKAFSLIENGLLDVAKLPGDIKLNEKQQIQVDAIRSNEPYINKEEIKTFLDTLEYPLYYLDFETLAPAIPLFDNSKPFQQIPFQFSLHIQESSGKEPKHISFLAEGNIDPRPELLALLKTHLGTQGSIVIYYAPFEKSKLNNAVEVYSEYQSWNTAIQQRIVDLVIPFKDFSYYHPSQEGSASIKSVLPALTEKGYEGMEIADGGTASREYLRVTFDQNVSDDEKNKVRKQLETYCGLDTMAMVRIVDKLIELSK